MLDDRSARLFARLAQGEPHLTAWLEGELAAVTKILVNNSDHAQLLRAQGKAQHLEAMLKLLAPPSATRRAPT